MKPGCKTLTRETKYADFIYAKGDAETMNSARDIVNSPLRGTSTYTKKNANQQQPKKKANQQQPR